MVSFHRKPSDRDTTDHEDPVVRQYRFLLREAPSDAVEGAHFEALELLSLELRRAILSTVQAGLVAGQRLAPSDTKQMAHLIVHGERRTPNAFLAACEPETLRTLAKAVVDSEAAAGSFGRYAGWDGADPESAEDTSGAGFNRKVGQRDPRDDVRVTGGGYGP
jgi:hypothetical protein